MTKIDNGTWVLVADGEKALILENITDDQHPNLRVVRKEEQENPPDRDQATDKAGRQADDGPGQRTALAETDFHQLAKDRFASDLADILYRHAHKGRFDKLVVVASPQVLGALRPELHKEVSDKIVAEIAKTLTNHPVVEIEQAIADEAA
ncbi:host attachment family protein [Limimaricola pyoseonensis]|uniref:Protein required for attachment to host cells n=1 Tax=Limimaricola pyoseonensis TaxID=521013 RepID=A0A1G6ZQV2_9RHOB|nr:host attachment family protein [Limimaricola pyoseonensis]SDE04930.1 Protein required for attachment to host cells [Limimaricola pyoseonensis]